jgi:hypothetical protein
MAPLIVHMLLASLGGMALEAASAPEEGERSAQRRIIVSPDPFAWWEERA